MIYDEKIAEATDREPGFKPGAWISTNVSGTAKNTYELVFDLGSETDEIKLWYRNYPLIHLRVSAD